MKEYGICNLSVVPLRAEASDKSEIISQLLFGDCFEVIETAEKWVKILTCFDQYTGWMDVKQYASIDERDFDLFNKGGLVLGAKVFQPIVKTGTSETVYLVAGSTIYNLNGNEFSLGKAKYSFPDEPVLARNLDFKKNIEETARFFLHAPYLWGGKSLFGIDCSGFTQIVYKMLGIVLRRDASQQAEQGEIVSFLQESRAGDLAFFDNEQGHITHVGIMLNEHEIIHASGRVKIDPVDDQGIYSLDLKKHTHKLRIIKRYNP